MDSLPDDLLCNLMLDFQPKPAADPLQTGPDPCNDEVCSYEMYDNHAEDRRSVDPPKGKQGGRKGKKKKPLKGITISLDEFSEGGVQGLIDQRKAENRESFTGQHSLNYSPTYQPHSPMQYLIPPPPPPPRRRPSDGQGVTPAASGFFATSDDQFYSASAAGHTLPPPPPFQLGAAQAAGPLPFDESQQSTLTQKLLAALSSLRIDINVSENTPHLLLEGIDEAACSLHFGCVEAAVENLLHEKKLLPFRVLRVINNHGLALLTFFSSKQAYLAMILLHDYMLCGSKLQAGMLQELPTEEWITESTAPLGQDRNGFAVRNSHNQPSVTKALADVSVNEIEHLGLLGSVGSDCGASLASVMHYKQALVLGCNNELLKQYQEMKCFKLKSRYLTGAETICNPFPTAMLLVNLVDCNLHGVWAASGKEVGSGEGRHVEFSEVLPGAILTSSEYGNLLKVADNQLLSLPVMLDFAQSQTLLKMMHSATVAKLHAAQPKVEEGITRPLQPQEAQNGAKPKLGEVQQQRAPYRPPQALPGGQGNSQGGKQPYCPPSYRPPSTASLQLPTSTSSSSAPRPFQPQPIQQAEARQLNPSPIAPPMGILPPRTAYMAPSQPYMPAFVMQTGPAWHAGGPPSLGPMMALPPGAMGSPTGWWPVQSVGMVPAPTQGIPIMLHEGMPPPPFHHHPAQAHIMATQMIPPPRPPPPTDPVPAGGELQAEPRAEAAAPVRQWEDASTSGWTQWAMGVHQGPRGPRQDRSRVVGEDQGPGENEPTASSALPPLPKDNQDEGVNQKRAEAEQPEYRKGYCRICRVNKSGYALPGCSHYGPCLSCVPDNSVDMYPTCLQCNQAVAKMIRIY